MFSGSPFLYLSQKVRNRSERMSESPGFFCVFFWEYQSQQQASTACSSCTLLINQTSLWMNLQQLQGAFDLWFCFVPGTVEGSLYAVHWARRVPYGMLKPREPWNFSGSRLRFMNTEHAQSIRQLSLWAARASRSTLWPAAWIDSGIVTTYSIEVSAGLRSVVDSLLFFSLWHVLFVFLYIPSFAEATTTLYRYR